MPEIREAVTLEKLLASWPKQRRIDIVAPDQVKLEVEEEKIRGDQWADKPGILPAYNAYSPSGDVTGEIVYVNFGIPADYETLDTLGISVKGKIVLATVSLIATLGEGWVAVVADADGFYGLITRFDLLNYLRKTLS